MRRFIEKKDDFSINFIYSILSKVVPAVALVIYDALVARKLGIEEYSEWTFFFAILTMFFYVGWLGINAATKVFVSKCITQEDNNKVIWASIRIRFLASVIFAVVMVIIIGIETHLIATTRKYRNLNILLFWSVAIVFVNSFTEYFKELLIGLKKYKLLAIFSVFEYAGYLVCTALFMIFNNNVINVARGYLVGGIIALFCGYILVCKTTGFSITNKATPNNNLTEKMMKYAIPLAIMGLGSVVLIEMDTFLLGILSTKIETATYSIGKNLCSKLAHINYALATAVIPSVTLRIEKGLFKKRDLKKYEFYNCIISIVVFLCIFIFAEIYIAVIYGNQYSNATVNLRMLAPYYLMTGFAVFYAQFLDFTGKARARVIVYAIMIILNFVLDVLLIPKMGAIGASLATDLALVPYFVLTFIMTKQRVNGME